MDQTLQGPTGAAPPDWRGLCEELADKLAACWPSTFDAPDCLSRAREALAQPEPEVVGPLDEELLRMAAEAIDPYDTIGIGEYEAETECAVEVYGSELIAFARAVLARFGRPAPAPAGERQAAPLPDRLPELRGMFERILCVARSSDQKPVGNIELADRLIKAVVSWAASGAALAKPVGEGSSDEYLNRVYQGAYQPAWERGEFYGAHYDGLRAVAAAVAADLLEQRHPAPVPPVEGEVGELVAWLRQRWPRLAHIPNSDYVMGVRAADLLERLASPACFALKPSPELTEAFKDLPPGRIELLPEDAQVIEPTEHTILVPARTPVPVAERLPGVEDCDAEGRCWWWDGEWGLVEQRFTVYHATHWLPATALPVPQGEVE